MQSTSKTRDVLILSLIKGIGSQTIKSLFREIDDLESIERMTFVSFKNRIKLRNAEEVFHILKSDFILREAARKADEILLKADKSQIEVVGVMDLNYPAKLKVIADPPPILYGLGNFSLLQMSACVAIVGTRAASQPGIEITSRISRRFAGYGFCIVSGLAKGIDTAAHKAALEVNGLTIAVLGTSVEISKTYPRENINLAEGIINANGLLVSEIPPGQNPDRRSFVKRDRIQSGISLAVFPIETDLEGGTMHTVNFALQQGKPLFCPKPPPHGNSMTRGIKKLLFEDKSALMINDKDDYPLIAKVLCEYSSKVLKDPIPSRIVGKVEEDLSGTNFMKASQSEEYFRTILQRLPPKGKSKRERKKKEIVVTIDKKSKMIKRLERIISELKKMNLSKDPEIQRVIKSMDEE